MILTPLLTVVFASLAQLTVAQTSQRPDGNGPINYDAEHNATSIVGTWSSGSQAVSTGPGFCDPAKLTFNYPKNTGVSYTFSSDGFFEVARYRFNSNGSDPTCITGVIGWLHGSYSLNANGSITLVPLGDGFQQVQDPCAATSNFIETYNNTEYYQGWRIFRDPTAGPKLHLFGHDGMPVAPQFQVSTTPNMFPPQLLRNNTFVTVSRRSVDGEEDLERRGSGAETVFRQSKVVGFVGAAGLLAAVSLVL